MASFTNLITLQDLINVKTSTYIGNTDYRVWKSVRYPKGLVLPKCEVRYRKKVGNDVVEMTPQEKLDRDAELQASLDIVLESQKDITKADILIKALSLVLLDEINLLRIKVNLSERTVDNLKSAIINKYNNLS